MFVYFVSQCKESPELLAVFLFLKGKKCFSRDLKVRMSIVKVIFGYRAVTAPNFET